MHIENYIESKYREVENMGIETEYDELYKSVKHNKLKIILSTLHYYYIELFRSMNQRLPTNDNGDHFWAEPSRSLINIINISLNLYEKLKNSVYAFKIDEYYEGLMKKCKEFLSPYGGSELPPNMDEIELYYTIPIFITNENVTIQRGIDNAVYPIKEIGEGSYAHVYKYRDPFYNRYFVIKRAKKNLIEKELERFKREYQQMRNFSSPYIVEVYRYDDEKNEYIMEYMDNTLDSYIKENNNKLKYEQRKRIARQVLEAFRYIHSKNILHRDISPKNILVKEYESLPIIKIADFGLVKVPDSTLTTVNTEFKGYFNDPLLKLEGFDKYDIVHEIYALTYIVYYIMTGKTNTSKIKDNNLKMYVEKGLNSDKEKRFKNVEEMIRDFKGI